jgi:hypothetical protein
MRERFIKLLELKSIITLILVIAGVYGFVTKTIAADVFTGWVGMILVFYFQKDKSNV